MVSSNTTSILTSQKKCEMKANPIGRDGVPLDLLLFSSNFPIHAEKGSFTLRDYYVDTV